MGDITLTSASETFTVTSTETGFATGASSTDSVTFDAIDLTGVPSVQITGNFNDESGEDFPDYSASTPAFGTFTIDANTGQFTYTVTQAEAVAAASGGTASSNVTVTGDDALVTGSTDDDTLTFNFTVCFGRGTMIATPDGERPVETLAIGDRVLTADGRAVPVLWMGINAVSPMFRPADRLEPVLIEAGALEPMLGEALPVRDLVVTADHGMVIGDYVINASALVGAAGIRFLDWRKLGGDFAYYHIETEGHEVVRAEGAPAETYVDYVGRRSFDNHAEYEALYGAERLIPEMDRPRISSARLLPDDIRQALGIAVDRSAEAPLDAAFERAA